MVCVEGHMKYQVSTTVCFSVHYFYLYNYMQVFYFGSTVIVCTTTGRMRGSNSMLR